jgi:hypothetical protein
LARAALLEFSTEMTGRSLAVTARVARRTHCAEVARTLTRQKKLRSHSEQTERRVLFDR